MARTRGFEISCKYCNQKLLVYRRSSQFCSRSCVAQYYNKVDKKNRGPRKTIQEKNRCLELYRDGESYRQIACKLQCGHRWIRKVLKENGVVGIERKYKSWDLVVSKASFKRKLIKERGHQCQRCTNRLWEGEPIPLEVHHIDGNKACNVKSNLLLLCSNCHALTGNYCKKNVRDKMNSGCSLEGKAPDLGSGDRDGRILHPDQNFKERKE